MKRLEEIIGYRFKDISLLEKALTHSSYTRENNLPRTMCSERLEFLGDAAIETIICEKLYQICPQEREGELTKHKSNIVCSESLAHIARKIQLGSYLRLGNGEIKSKGCEKNRILEDAMEALAGAVFYDGGYESAKNVLLPLFEEQIDKALAGELDNNYKSAFQEIVQSNGNVDIYYRVIEEVGQSHDKVFTVELSLNGKAVGLGEGKSKKEAENNAARDAITKINV